MNKYLFLLIFLISTSGCQNSMDALQGHISQLVTNTQEDNEKTLATKLQIYASTNKLSYQLEVSANGTEIPMAELDKHLNEPLMVTITADGNAQQWKPLDNKNLFILLRE